MKTRKTIKEMFREIVLNAGVIENMKDADFAIEHIGDFYYRAYIEMCYYKFQNQERTANEIVAEIADNLSGRVFNGLAVLVGRQLKSIIA